MSKQHDLKSRFLINGLSAFLIAFLIIFGGHAVFRWIFVSAVALLTGVALFEYNYILKKKGLEPARILAVVAGLLYVFALFIKIQAYSPAAALWQNLPQILIALSFFACFVYFAFFGNEPILNISSTFLGIIYIAVPLGVIVQVMYFFSAGGIEDPYFRGSWWILYLLAVTKSSDMGGYFVGGFLGRRKLAHRLSPNKTLEGALGGLIASTGVSLLICYLGKSLGGVFENFTYLESIWLGILVGILGQMGDLAESLLKRDAQVKDSGIIPGVGGILDMVDSLLFTAPVVYIFLRVIYT